MFVALVLATYASVLPELNEPELIRPGQSRPELVMPALGVSVTGLVVPLPLLVLSPGRLSAGRASGAVGASRAGTWDTSCPAESGKLGGRFGGRIEVSSLKVELVGVS